MKEFSNKVVKAAEDVSKQTDQFIERMASSIQTTIDMLDTFGPISISEKFAMIENTFDVLAEAGELSKDQILYIKDQSWYKKYVEEYNAFADSILIQQNGDSKMSNENQTNNTTATPEAETKKESAVKVVAAKANSMFKSTVDTVTDGKFLAGVAVGAVAIVGVGYMLNKKMGNQVMMVQPATSM